MNKNPKVIAVLPAYQAEHTLASFFKILPRMVFDQVILSDDSSTDKTFDIAKKQKGIDVFKTPKNLGYGGNMKFCLSKALEEGGDIIVEIHPDGEYLPDGILKAIKEIEEGAQLVLGNRFTHGKPKGMYLWKYIPSRILTWLDNIILGFNIPDMHQGFHVYTKDFLEKINFKANDNDYVFTFQIILQALFNKVSIKCVPVTAVYSGKKRGAFLASSVVYSIGTFKVLALFFLQKLGLKSRIFEKQQKVPPCLNCNVSYLTYRMYRNLFFCDLCQNGFFSPQPKSMNKYYPQTYWNYQGITGAFRRIIFRIAQRRRRVWVEKYLPNGGKMLDVGSGEGEFGKSLSKKFKITNIEAPFAKIRNESILKTDFLKWKTDKKFNAICFWESLEHVPSPQLSLRKAFKLLDKGGLIFIEYPRFNSFESKILGKNWFHLDVPRHFSHFTDEGIRALLERSGFSIFYQNSISAFEYGPPGLFLSLKRIFGIHFFIFIPFMIPILLIEIFRNDYPIGLIVTRKE